MLLFLQYCHCPLRWLKGSLSQNMLPFFHNSNLSGLNYFWIRFRFRRDIRSLSSTILTSRRAWNRVVSEKFGYLSKQNRNKKYFRLLFTVFRPLMGSNLEYRRAKISWHTPIKAERPTLYIRISSDNTVLRCVGHRAAPACAPQTSCTVYPSLDIR